eukprot:366394-Chlamydomonas_euryale.AAC.2
MTGHVSGTASTPQKQDWADLCHHATIQTDLAIMPPSKQTRPSRRHPNRPRQHAAIQTDPAITPVHLQQQPVEVADLVGVERAEGLGAVAALHDERVAARRSGQAVLQVAALASCK